MATTNSLDKYNGTGGQCKPDDTTPAVSTDKEKSSSSSGDVLKLWKDFGDITSMHGLGRAVNSSRIWKRIVWSILVLVAAAVAARNLYMTFVDYYSYPVSTVVNLETKLMLDFPAVTICNLNSYRFRYLKDEITKGLEKSIEQGDSEKMQKETFRMLFNKHYDPYELPFNLTHSMLNMLIDCQFEMESCSYDDFLPVPNIKNGDCYTFNYGNNTQTQRRATRAGNRNGLVLELDVEQDDYLPYTPAAGLKVLIHPPETVPFPYEDGIVVRPGVSTNIGLRKVSVERQIPPWGVCIKEEDTDFDDMNMFRTNHFNGHKYGYSQMACEKTCYQSELVRNCECCDMNYPCFSKRDNPVYECNITRREDFDCLNLVRNLYLSGKLECMLQCRLPCKETMYKSSYSVAAWPSARYVHYFKEKADTARLKRNQTGKVTLDELRRNYVRLEVYYEKLTEESVLTTPTYNWNKLLSDLGGQLGLWMGFSLMTAVEFLELSLDLVGTLCCKLRGSSGRSNGARC